MSLGWMLFWFVVVVIGVVFFLVWLLSDEDICHRCKVTKTENKVDGVHTCPECQVALIKEHEGDRTCPIDGVVMQKEHHEGVVIDRCPTCRGVWLDPEELKTIGDQLRSAGQSSGMATGICLGIAI